MSAAAGAAAVGLASFLLLLCPPGGKGCLEQAQLSLAGAKGN